MTDNNSVVYVVDDDENINNLIKLYLSKEGYTVEKFANGISAIDAFKANAPDIIILDIMMPLMDGWEVCREIRKTSDVPIIMLSARGETFDKVLGLELGADDYMVKPFDPKELTARVKAILRRVREPRKQNEEVTFPNLVVSLTNYTVTFLGEKMELPPKELELLYFLASNPNQVYTREQLLEHVWGFDFYGDSRTVDVHVKRLREKLISDKVDWQIKTVWGVGYKFEVK